MKRGRTAALALTLLLLAAIVILTPPLVRGYSQRSLGLGENAEGGLPSILGDVISGRLYILAPNASIGPVRLTRMGMQEARPPESDEIDLGPYEGALVVIQGHDGGGWIYSAQVVQRVEHPVLGPLIRYAWRPSEP